VPIVTPTKISLISDALVLLGEKPASSLTEDRYGMTVGSNLFEAIYENELTSNRWRFAMTKAQLSQLVSVPLNEWKHAYQLPSDMLMPIGVYPKAQYEIYADHLYTNRSTVELDYLFKPDVPEIPPYFAQLMRYALARDMIKPITESDTGVSIMQQKYSMQRDRAMFADAQGRPNISIQHSPFTAGRDHTSR
jgi:hypothetical protein